MRTAVLILLLSFIPLFAGDTLADTLCIAALKGDQDAAARLLERGADCNEINRTGSSPLSCAVIGRQYDMLLFLLRRGAQADTDETISPLFRAAESRQFLMVRALIRADADVNRGNPEETALSAAVRVRDIDSVRLLLAAKALPDRACTDAATGAAGMTPLMFAARSGDAAIIRLLLSAQADPALKNAAGKSALDFAREGNHVDAIELLTAAARP